MTQPEALRLADALEAEDWDWNEVPKAAAELRRLYAVNQELLEALEKAVKLNGFREFNDHIPTMKAVIAKAGGKT